MKVTCTTKGASIGYRTPEAGKRWLVYTEPIQLAAGSKLVVKAVRIGYKPSSEVRIDTNLAR